MASIQAALFWKAAAELGFMKFRKTDRKRGAIVKVIVETVKRRRAITWEALVPPLTKSQAIHNLVSMWKNGRLRRIRDVKRSHPPHPSKYVLERSNEPR